MIINRPQITCRQAINFLEEYPDDTLIFCATSELVEDEPEETQELVSEDRLVCVAIEAPVKGGEEKYIAFGYIKDTK